MIDYTDYTQCDYNLFTMLNFDGGAFMDKLMLIVSGTLMWLPLYALIFWLVYRQTGWRNTLLFVVLLAAAIGLSDMVCGIFKHSGLLGDLLPGFEPRCRPMYTPSLEGFAITPDSLSALRHAALPDAEWRVHVPAEAFGGRYGTVSAHAATIVALAVMSAAVVRKVWFSALVVCCTLLICYSRIYLGKHFPLDLVWGTLTGMLLGVIMVLIYTKLKRNS